MRNQNNKMKNLRTTLEQRHLLLRYDEISSFAYLCSNTRGNNSAKFFISDFPVYSNC
jgi:hypothetical protein